MFRKKQRCVQCNRLTGRQMALINGQPYCRACKKSPELQWPGRSEPVIVFDSSKASEYMLQMTAAHARTYELMRQSLQRPVIGTVHGSSTGRIVAQAQTQKATLEATAALTKLDKLISPENRVEPEPAPQPIAHTVSHWSAGNLGGPIDYNELIGQWPFDYDLATAHDDRLDAMAMALDNIPRHRAETNREYWKLIKASLDPNPIRGRSADIVIIDDIITEPPFSSKLRKARVFGADPGDWGPI